MLFHIKNVGSKDIAVSVAKRRAKRVVLMTPMGATERRLDEYIKKHYGMSLNVACLAIVCKAKYDCQEDGTVTVILPDKRLDEIAGVITFGTGKLVGSDILRRAFGSLNRKG